MTKMNINVALIFSYGVSIKTWRDTGLFSREVAPYEDLGKLGFKINFLSYGNHSSNLDIENIHVEPLGKTGFLKILRLKGIDIFKTNQMWGAWLGVIAKFIHRKPLYVRIGYEHYQFQLLRRTKFYKRWIGFLNSMIAYHYADIISVTSYEQKEFILKNFFIKPEKIKVHFNYIDTDTFKPFENIDRDDGILFVGRLNEQKNLFPLIAACAKLKCRLTIIGEGELKKELEKYSADVGCDITFLGRIPNNQLPPYFNRHKIFALTSNYEGNPKTLLEAMSCGSCCLVTNAPGIREIVKHKSNAYLVDKEVNSIAEGLNELLNDSKLQDEMRVLAREYSLKNCTLQSLVNFEIDIFKKLLNR